MRILTIHNYYQQPGGEDTVFHAEKELLKRAGHEVTVYERHNTEITGYSLAQRIRLFRHAVWASASVEAIQRVLQRIDPHVAHFHNTLPLISPAAYYACQEAGVPVVQTLHNYRLLCPDALFLRDGCLCEDCLHKLVPWPAVLHACYRNSRAQSAVVMTMLTIHRWLKTWKEQVDAYIALTDFCRNKFIQGGLPPEKLMVKPNFVDPTPDVRTTQGDYALFIGRLSVEKGIRTLLAAWENLPKVPLKIAGDGPLLNEARAFVRRHGLNQVEVLGRIAHSAVMSLMKNARFLVFPSEWYEGFPMTLVEALASGVPVVASRLGSMAEIIEENRTGLHFTPGDAADLASRVSWLWAQPAETRRMGRKALADYEAKYTAKENYDILMGIYKRVIERKG